MSFLSITSPTPATNITYGQVNEPYHGWGYNSGCLGSCGRNGSVYCLGLAVMVLCDIVEMSVGLLKDR